MTETIQDAPETNDTVAATPAQEVTAVEAPAAYAKCAGCHGMDGKTKALGKSEIIAGQAEADLIAKINEYKAGSRNVAGMGTLMQGQVAMLSDEDIQAIAAYISNLK
ncbi:MAG: c-type cytochrome [Campylobacterales bacterium]|nr:c-type cytochrome [Campylobacterales bacterium]